MNGWTITEVWDIDGKMVVGKTLEEALAIWRKYMGFSDLKEPRRIERMYIGSPILGNSAIIKEETPECGLTNEQVAEVVRALKNYRLMCLSWETQGCEYIAEQLLNRFIGKPDIKISTSDEAEKNQECR